MIITLDYKKAKNQQTTDFYFYSNTPVQAFDSIMYKKINY